VVLEQQVAELSAKLEESERRQRSLATSWIHKFSVWSRMHSPNLDVVEKCPDFSEFLQGLSAKWLVADEGEERQRIRANKLQHKLDKAESKNRRLRIDNQLIRSRRVKVDVRERKFSKSVTTELVTHYSISS
jgi:hypothetical protein